MTIPLARAYHGYINNESILNQLTQYPLISESRIDCRFTRYSRLVNNQLIDYEAFNPTAYYYERYANNQTNERNNQMTTLAEKIQARLGDQVKHVTLQSNTPSMQSLTDKLQAKKGLAQQTVDLSIEKFVAIENLQKSIGVMQAVLTAHGNHIESIDKDMIAVCNAIKALQKVQTENNALLLNIAKQLTSISSVQTIEVRKSSTPNNTPVSAPVQSTASNASVHITTNGVDYSGLYQSFMTSFGQNFMGTKDCTHLTEFAQLIDSIDWTSADTIDKSIRSHWTKVREYNTANGIKPAQLWAAKLQDRAIKALIAIGNKPIADSTVSSPVKDTAYWVNHYGIDRSVLQQFIDFAKSNSIGDEEKTLFQDHLNEVAVRHATHEFNDFIAWLKRFKG